MKVAVLNSCGNVGKTTVATHLLAPRLEGVTVLEIGGRSGRKPLHRESVSDLFAGLLENNPCIVDVGSDATREFLDGMRRYASVHTFLDLVVIPVTRSSKAQQDTITTLEILENLNVETGKILIVFNRVESDVDDEFFTLLNFMEKNNITIKTQAAIFENELFDELAIKKMTIEQLLDDPTDYKSLLRENREADPRQRDHWADMFGLKCLAKHVKKNLDDCFAELPPLRP